MSFLRSFFQKKAEEDYEARLSNLADDIQKRQLQLSEIRLRERRSTLLATLYTLAAWVAYFVIWYLNALPGLHGTHNPSIERAVRGIPIVVGPIIVLFIRRIFQIWYMRKGDREEKALKDLIKRRREKVVEIKKKTNYYSTRDLLQKYDESSAESPAPLRRRFPVDPLVPATPRRPVQHPQANNGLPPQMTPSANPQMTPVTPNHAVTAGRKQWYDRLADAILGDEDLTPASPSSRYALICEKCFAHNGLVKENVWEDAQYVCPKCNHFNQSTRAKRQRTISLLSDSPNASPASSNTISTPERQRPSPSPKTPTSDLPTVDTDESMSMVVDAELSKSP